MTTYTAERIPRGEILTLKEKWVVDKDGFWLLSNRYGCAIINIGGNNDDQYEIQEH